MFWDGLPSALTDLIFFTSCTVMFSSIIVKIKFFEYFSTTIIKNALGPTVNDQVEPQLSKKFGLLKKFSEMVPKST